MGRRNRSRVKIEPKFQNKEKDKSKLRTGGPTGLFFMEKIEGIRYFMDIEKQKQSAGRP